MGWWRWRRDSSVFFPKRQLRNTHPCICFRAKCRTTRKRHQHASRDQRAGGSRRGGWTSSGLDALYHGISRAVVGALKAESSLEHQGRPITTYRKNYLSRSRNLQIFLRGEIKEALFRRQDPKAIAEFGKPRGSQRREKQKVVGYLQFVYEVITNQPRTR